MSSVQLINAQRQLQWPCTAASSLCTYLWYYTQKNMLYTVAGLINVCGTHIYVYIHRVVAALHGNGCHLKGIDPLIFDNGCATYSHGMMCIIRSLTVWPVACL